MHSEKTWYSTHSAMGVVITAAEDDGGKERNDGHVGSGVVHTYVHIVDASIDYYTYDFVYMYAGRYNIQYMRSFSTPGEIFPEYCRTLRSGLDARHNTDAPGYVRLTVTSSMGGFFCAVPYFAIPRFCSVE